MFIITVMMTTVTILGIVLFGDIGNQINMYFSSGAGADMMTMTGRDKIWAVALNEWHNNPMFGYGLTIWNEAYQAKIGIPGAVSAHNQFFQTLSSAGIIGVSGLFVYVTTLFWFSLKTAKSSQGLTIALFGVLIFRSISESAFTINSIEFTHILLLMIIGAQFKPNNQQKPFMSPTQNAPQTFS
jgi:O-antigen ligase